MKQLYSFALILVLFAAGAGASNDNVTRPGTPAQHWIDMIQPHTINSFHLPPDIAAIAHRRAHLDAIAEATGNPAEFMAHHVLEMSRVPLSILHRGLEKGHFGGALQLGPVYTFRSESYYKIEEFVCEGGRSLLLGDRSIALLSPALGNMHQLTGVYLQCNHLTFVPNALWNLHKLTELSLWNNKLTSLSEDIGKLTQLTKLLLTSNPFTAVPQSCQFLINLTEISISPHQWADLQTKHVLQTLHANQGVAGKALVKIWIYLNDYHRWLFTPESQSWLQLF